MRTTFTESTRARVRLRPDCPGTRPRRNCRVEITAVGRDGDHSVIALYKGGACDVPGPPGSIRRDFRPDELEPIEPP